MQRPPHPGFLIEYVGLVTMLGVGILALVAPKRLLGAVVRSLLGGGGAT